MRAVLLEDGGAAARSPDFFRSAEFQAAEGVTHSLVVEGRFAAALVVREIPGSGGLRDATSSYGYPGALTEGEPLDPAAVDWSATGLVSVFLRDAIGRPPCLQDGTVRSDVQLVDPSGPFEPRSTHARHVRRNERLGYTTAQESGPGPRADFQRVYTETMKRTGASERYFFRDDYFERVLASKRALLLVTRAPDGRAAAAAIVVESDALLHYYLGGSAGELLEHSPFKSTVAAMIELARERGLALNLGGGVRPGDALDHFKRGFANAAAPFRTYELVCDRQAYDELSAGRPESGFFPLYRS